MEKLTMVATQFKDPLVQPAFGNSSAQPPPSAKGQGEGSEAKADDDSKPRDPRGGDMLLLTSSFHEQPEAEFAGTRVME